MSAPALNLLAHVVAQLVAGPFDADEVGIATPADFDGGKFVRVNLLGSRPVTMSNHTLVHVLTSDVSIHVYDVDELATIETAGEAIDVMCALGSTNDVSVPRSRLVTGPTWLPDESRPGVPYTRVVATFAVTYHPT